MDISLDLNIENALKKIGEKYNIEKIVLFGSRARNDNRKNSDVDLAIFSNNKKESSIYFEIEEIETLLKFDIAFINKTTNKKLVENINNEGVIIYGKNKK